MPRKRSVSRRVIIDACYAAAGVTTGGFRPGPMGDRGLGQLAYDKGMRILAATQADSVALESAGLQHGILTYALLIEGLQARLADWDPADGRIMEDEWLAYAVRRVPQLYLELASGVFQGRGFRLFDSDERRVSIQQPELFDFRSKCRPNVEIGVEP